MTFIVKLTNFWLQNPARLLSSPCGGISSYSVAKKTNHFRLIENLGRKRISSSVRVIWEVFSSGDFLTAERAPERFFRIRIAK